MKNSEVLFLGEKAGADPAPEGVAPEKGFFGLFQDLVHLFGVTVAVFAGDDGDVRVQFLDDAGRVAGGNDVGGDVGGDHGAGADDAVFADGDAFADDCGVADPDVLFQGDLAGLCWGQGAVVDAVPVGVGDVAVGGEHAGVPDGDGIGRGDADARGEQDVVTDGDALDVFVFGPDGEPGFFVRAAQEGDVAADGDRAAEDFDVPGFDDEAVGAQTFQFGGQVTADPEVLEAVPGLFHPVGAVVFHGSSRAGLCTGCRSSFRG